MNGLGRRQIIPLPAGQKEELEILAQHITDWRNHGPRVCASCDADWWGPKLISGSDCPKCCEHEPVRGYIIKVNGDALAQAMCFRCGRRGDIRKDDLQPVLDICFRNNIEPDSTRSCQHCGATGTETHHWAPRAIFNDPDQWPTADLCRRCHRQWHAAMREARGVSLPPGRRYGTPPKPWYAA